MFPRIDALWMRRGGVLLGSAGFLWLQTPSPVHLATLLAFVLSGYAVAQLLTRRPSRALLTLYLIALTVAFLVLKRYEFLRLIGGDSLIAHALDLVGLSFIFFRQIHVVVDVSQKDIRALDLLAYLAYQLNPLTLLAGPIQRYQRFHEDWGSLQPSFADVHELRMTLMRLFVGAIKVVIVAEFCLWLAFNPPASLAAWSLPLQFYLFPAYVYFNFAGYCDIVISAGKLFGVRIPENFDRPYLARNMIDYWTRWHRTLSFWIRDYIFTPLYMAIARGKPTWAPHLVFLCYFLALFLAGVWHGASWNFVIFGLLNGAGVSAAKVWENVIIARVGRKGLKAYLANTPILWTARIGTVHFACLTMVFLRPEGTDKLISWSQKLFDLVGRLTGA